MFFAEKKIIVKSFYRNRHDIMGIAWWCGRLISSIVNSFSKDGLNILRSYFIFFSVLLYSFTQYATNLNIFLLSTSLKVIKMSLYPFLRLPGYLDVFKFNITLPKTVIKSVDHYSDWGILGIRTNAKISYIDVSRADGIYVF